MLTDDRNRLSRCDVVAWAPVVIVGDGVEVLSNDLLPARESVAATHAGNYARSTTRVMTKQRPIVYLYHRTFRSWAMVSTTTAWHLESVADADQGSGFV